MKLFARFWGPRRPVMSGSYPQVPPTSLPHPSSFLSLPLGFGFGRVCSFVSAGLLYISVKIFLQARPIEKAWRYVYLGVCVCVRAWVCTCTMWLGCKVDCPKADKAASSGFVCNANTPTPLVVCCVGIWRPGLWCVGLWSVGMWFLGLWCMGLLCAGLLCAGSCVGLWCVGVWYLWAWCVGLWFAGLWRVGL